MLDHCVYEQVSRDMDVFCVRTQIFQEMLFDLPTLDYLHVYLLRFDESVSAQNPTMVADFYVSIGNYANRYLEFLRICAKNPRLYLGFACLRK